MKFIQILLSLSALTFFGATATPVGNGDIPADRPISLPLEAIPAGDRIFGLDGNSSLIERGDAGPFGLTKRNDCDGSGACTLLKLTGSSCPSASNGYDDNSWYCGYTSRVSGHCTSIFTCGDYHGTCWAGWFLKQQ